MKPSEQLKLVSSGLLHEKTTSAHAHSAGATIERLAAAVAALELDARRYRWLRHGDNDERCIRLTIESQPYMLRAALLDRCIDEAIADDADKAAHTVAVPAVGAA